MSKNGSGASGSGSRPNRRPPRRPGSKASGARTHAIGSRRPRPKPGFKIVEKGDAELGASQTEQPAAPVVTPFRVLIAVHRPRFRGRAERAAALAGWEITTLLNKQDVVGQVAKLPRPPDLVVLSGDFGRQRDYAIFRAIQSWRKEGMHLIGMVEDCQTAPEAFPESAPERLCDTCLVPPYKTAELRALFARLYEEMRGVPAPPPRSASTDTDLDDEAEES